MMPDVNHRSRRSGGLGVGAPKGRGAPAGPREARLDESAFPGASAEGAAVVAREERAIRKLLGCPLCGRAGGSIPKGREWCATCLAELEPTPLQEWSRATGFELKELVALTGLAKRTVMRAARGVPVDEKSAAALARVTGIAPSKFTRAA